LEGRAVVSATVNSESGLDQEHRPSRGHVARGQPPWRDAAVVVAICIVVSCVGALSYAAARPTQFVATTDVLVQPVVTDAGLQGLPIVYDSTEPVRAVQTAVGLLDTDEVADATAQRLGGSWTARKVADAVTVQARGESFLVEILARAGSSTEARRVTDTFAQSALALQDDKVKEAARRESASLAALLSDPVVPADDLRRRILGYDSVAQNGDPSLSLSSQSRLPVAEGLPLSTMALLGGVFGLLLGSVLAYARIIRHRQHPAVGMHLSPNGHEQR